MGSEIGQLAEKYYLSIDIENEPVSIEVVMFAATVSVRLHSTRGPVY